MPDMPSITLVKQFTYDEKVEQYSNTYHFSGTTPSNTAGWQTLGEAIWALEKTAVKSQVSLAGIYGYEAGNNFSVAQIDYTVPPLALIPGVGSWTGNAYPGDTAVWVRWRTPQRNSRGKYIYLRKYFHPGYSGGATPDKVVPEQAAALANLGAKMIDGTLPGGVKVAGPQGAVASAPLVATYYTTRTLKRRGKRPSS